MLAVWEDALLLKDEEAKRWMLDKTNSYGGCFVTVGG